MVQPPVGDEEHLPVAFLAIDDPRQVNPRLTDEVAAELDRELGAGEFVGKVLEALGQRPTDRRDVERPIYEQLVESQLRESQAKQGPGDLQAMFDSGDTWVVR